MISTVVNELAKLSIVLVLASYIEVDNWVIVLVFNVPDVGDVVYIV